jgi:NOL1/NOP2/fmu family ribosome biogenesis protein
MVAALIEGGRKTVGLSCDSDKKQGHMAAIDVDQEKYRSHVNGRAVTVNSRYPLLWAPVRRPGDSGGR